MLGWKKALPSVLIIFFTLVTLATSGRSPKVAPAPPPIIVHSQPNPRFDTKPFLSVLTDRHGYRYANIMQLDRDPITETELAWQFLERPQEKRFVQLSEAEDNPGKMHLAVPVRLPEGAGSHRKVFALGQIHRLYDTPMFRIWGYHKLSNVDGIEDAMKRANTDHLDLWEHGKLLSPQQVLNYIHGLH